MAAATADSDYHTAARLYADAYPYHYASNDPEYSMAAVEKISPTLKVLAVHKDVIGHLNTYKAYVLNQLDARKDEWATLVSSGGTFLGPVSELLEKYLTRLNRDVHAADTPKAASSDVATAAAHTLTARLRNIRTADSIIDRKRIYNFRAVKPALETLLDTEKYKRETSYRAGDSSARRQWARQLDSEAARYGKEVTNPDYNVRVWKGSGATLGDQPWWQEDLEVYVKSIKSRIARVTTARELLDDVLRLYKAADPAVASTYAARYERVETLKKIFGDSHIPHELVDRIVRYLSTEPYLPDDTELVAASKSPASMSSQSRFREKKEPEPLVGFGPVPSRGSVKQLDLSARAVSGPTGHRLREAQKKAAEFKKRTEAALAEAGKHEKRAAEAEERYKRDAAAAGRRIEQLVTQGRILEARSIQAATDLANAERAASAKISALEQQGASKDDEIARARAEHATAQKIGQQRLDGLRQEVEKGRKDADALQEQLRAQSAQFDADRAKLQKAVDDAVQVAKQNETAAAEAVQRLDEMVRQNEQLAQQLDAAKKQADALRTRSKQADAAADQKVRDLQASIEKLREQDEAREKEFEAKLADGAKRLQEAQSAVDQVRKEADANAVAAAKQIEQLKADAAKSEAALAEEMKLRGLKVSEISKEYEAKQAVLAKKLEDTAKAETEARELAARQKDEIAGLVGANAALAQSQAAAQQKLAALEKDAAVLKQKLEAAEAKAAQQQEELAEKPVPQAKQDPVQPKVEVAAKHPEVAVKQPAAIEPIPVPRPRLSDPAPSAAKVDASAHKQDPQRWRNPLSLPAPSAVAPLHLPQAKPQPAAPAAVVAAGLALAAPIHHGDGKTAWTDASKLDAPQRTRVKGDCTDALTPTDSIDWLAHAQHARATHPLLALTYLSLAQSKGLAKDTQANEWRDSLERAYARYTPTRGAADDKKTADAMQDAMRNMVPQSELPSDWGAVVGYEDVKRYLSRERQSGRPVRIVFAGPPGTGKTMLARAFAGSHSLALFALTAATLAAAFVGQAEALIDGLFTAARARAPSLIFLDEVDALRGGSAAAVLNQQLLQSPDVAFMAATNRHWALADTGLSLPPPIYLGFPTKADRKTLLTKQLAPPDAVISPSELERLVGRTVHFSFDDLAKLVARARAISLTHATGATAFRRGFTPLGLGWRVCAADDLLRDSNIKSATDARGRVARPPVTFPDVLWALGQHRPTVTLSQRSVYKDAPGGELGIEER